MQWARFDPDISLIQVSRTAAVPAVSCMNYVRYGVLSLQILWTVCSFNFCLHLQSKRCKENVRDLFTEFIRRW
jgi:hypothetical protein